MKRLLDQRGDVQEVYHRDGDKIHIQTYQDVAQYLRTNREDMGQHRARSHYGEGMHRVASIPEVVLAQWWKELGSNPLAKQNRKWLISKLNSNEFVGLRTRPGKL